MSQITLFCIFTLFGKKPAGHSLPPQFSSVTQSGLTLWDPMDCITEGLPVHDQLPEITQTHDHWVSDGIQSSHALYQTHDHWVSDGIQSSHPLSYYSPPAFNLSQHQGFFNESVLCMRWPKYWSFSFNISPSNEHPGPMSFRMDWLDILVVQGTLKSLLQHHSSKASIFWCSASL